MTTRRRLTVAAVVVLMAVVGGACGGDASDLQVADPFTPRTPVVVESSTPDPLLVPAEVPDGFVLDTATIVEDRTEGSDHFILFGEADQPDLADGKQLLVGFFSSSTYGLFDCAANIGDVATCRGWTVAPLSYPGCNDDCWAFVMGRNVTEGEVATAAAGLAFDGSEPSLAADALPTGVTQLVDARVSVFRGLIAPGAQAISHSPQDGRALSITAVDGGTALADLYRFFFDADGAAAPFDSWGPQAAGAIRLDGDAVIAVVGRGFTIAEVNDVTDSMQRGGDDAWEQLRADAADRPLAELMDPEGDDPIVAVVEGRFSGGQWAVAYTDLGEFGLEHTVASNGPDPDDFTQSSDGAIEVPPSDELTILSGGGFGGGGFAGDVLDGFTPASTRSVRVIIDGAEFDAVLSEPSTLPGRPRLWAVFIEGDDLGPTNSTWIVIARDADGNELGRTTFD